MKNKHIWHNMERCKCRGGMVEETLIYTTEDDGKPCLECTKCGWCDADDGIDCDARWNERE